jgi:thiamine biosynthesis lipoprotein
VDSTPLSKRSRQTLRPSPRSRSLSFEAIGTGWQLDTVEPIEPALAAAVADRIEDFDKTWSRFRVDSLISRISTAPGVWEFPPDAPALFDTYRKLYAATDGAMSPLVGQTLDNLGYDRTYSLRASGNTIAAPAWDDAFAWDGHTLTTVLPVSIDVGAAGKGYLVDIVSDLLAAAGHEDFVVDGSGDIRRVGPTPIRVALEHPLDTTRAIGVVNVDAAICSSATNRRTWGDGLHHVIDATTGLPTRNVIATWAIAATALEADGLATALFFVDAELLAAQFSFSYVRMFANGTVEFSPNLDGELFT